MSPLVVEPTGLSSRKQQLKKKKKSWFCAPHPPLKTLNWSLSIDGEGRSRWRTVKARSARSCRSGSAQFSLKNSDYSFRVVPGAGGEKNDEHFSDDVRGFRQCVWSVRFYAVSTTWTSSLLPCPPCSGSLGVAMAEGGSGSYGTSHLRPIQAGRRRFMQNNAALSVITVGNAEVDINRQNDTDFRFLGGSALQIC